MRRGRKGRKEEEEEEQSSGEGWKCSSGALARRCPPLYFTHGRDVAISYVSICLRPNCISDSKQLITVLHKKRIHFPPLHSTSSLGTPPLITQHLIYAATLAVDVTAALAPSKVVRSVSTRTSHSIQSLSCSPTLHPNSNQSEFILVPEVLFRAPQAEPRFLSGPSFATCNGRHETRKCSVFPGSIGVDGSCSFHFYPSHAEIHWAAAYSGGHWDVSSPRFFFLHWYGERENPLNHCFQPTGDPCWRGYGRQRCVWT